MAKASYGRKKRAGGPYRVRVYPIKAHRSIQGFYVFPKPGFQINGFHSIPTGLIGMHGSDKFYVFSRLCG